MPRKRPLPQSDSVHRLKITLRNADPAIWRTVAVPSDFTLGDLHHVIQLAMGWEDDHLHHFQVGKVYYGDRRMPGSEDDEDEDGVTLKQIVPRARRKMRYTYDFGDNWEHDVQVEAVGLPEEHRSYPAVLAGERACPPEDCGGIWRYAYMLRVQADPTNPDYAEIMEWLGEPIDPAAFDLANANRKLHKATTYIWTP